MGEGVYYIAVGSKYYNEAVQSVQSLKRYNKNMLTSIATDCYDGIGLFDSVITLDPSQNDFRGKIKAMSLSPFEKTLFLDTDTLVLGELGDIFKLLQKHDMALAHAPKRETFKFEDVPLCYPEFNTGVMLFSRKAMNEIHESWIEVYEELLEKYKVHDQPALRKVLFESDLKVATLTPEYNFRLKSFGFVNGIVKIIHGRGSVKQVSNFVREINYSTNNRVVMVDEGELKVVVKK